MRISFQGALEPLNEYMDSTSIIVDTDVQQAKSWGGQVVCYKASDILSVLVEVKYRGPKIHELVSALKLIMENINSTSPYKRPKIIATKDNCNKIIGAYPLSSFGFDQKVMITGGDTVQAKFNFISS